MSSWADCPNNRATWVAFVIGAQTCSIEAAIVMVRRTVNSSLSTSEDSFSVVVVFFSVQSIAATLKLQQSTRRAFSALRQSRS